MTSLGAQSKDLLRFAAIGLFLSGSAFSSDQQDRVLIDPDIRVSYDGDGAHMEAPVATSADNPDDIYAAAEVLDRGRKLTASSAHIYYSSNAGAEWAPVVLPDEAAFGGWDNAIAAGRGNVSYFATHNYKLGLTVYRSRDAWRTWQQSYVGTDWDREYIAVDNTHSRYSGRLYLAGELDNHVQIISSSDGGSTFTKPIIACPARPGWSAATSPSLVVLDDGSLIVPCTPYPNYRERRFASTYDFGVVVSTDGGQSFSPYIRIGTLERLRTSEFQAAMADGILSGAAGTLAYAAAPSTGKYPNRIYAVWSSLNATRDLLLFLSYSDDRGMTWSEKREVGAPSEKTQRRLRLGNAMLAVNKDGVVGLSWFDARNAKNNEGYDIYFCASFDGGVTFTEPQRVTTATSYPAKSVDVITAPEIRVVESTALQIDTPYAIRSLGGDYSTMAVDLAGRFHPLWPDSRDGAWQLYTSTIRLQPVTAAHAQVPANDSRRCEMKSTRVIFDALSWDAATGMVSVPARIMNTGKDPIIGTILVRVAEKESASWKAIDPAVAATWPNVPILDTAKGVFSASAEVEYKISAEHPLYANAVTEARVWKLLVKKPEQLGLYYSLAIVGVGNACEGEPAR